jgi:apolipoprotein N-acyltransferase
MSLGELNNTSLIYRSLLRLGASTGSGALLAMGHPPLSLWWLSVISLAFIFELWHQSRNSIEAALVGGFSAFGYFIGSLYWLTAAYSALDEGGTFKGIISLSIGTATLLVPYWLIAFLIAYLFRSKYRLVKKTTTSVLLLCLLLAIAEWSRTDLLSHIPAAPLAYIWSDTPISQSASIFGTHGLSSITIILGGLLWSTFSKSSNRKYQMNSGIILMIFFASMLTFGTLRSLNQSVDLPVRIAIIHTGEHLNLLPEKTNAKKVIDNLIMLTKDAIKEGVQVILWPEGSTLRPLTEFKESITDLRNSLPQGTVLLAGTPRYVEQNGTKKEANSVIAISRSQGIFHTYDKVHPMPFGEYVPWLFRFLGVQPLAADPPGIFLGSPETQVINIAPLPSPLVAICYEAFLPHHIRDTYHQAFWAPRWIYNPTNDSWFEDTLGPSMQFHWSRYRSIELGLPFVRTSNIGISGVIDGYGLVRMTAVGPHPQILVFQLPEAIPNTIYLSFGEVFHLVILLLVAIFLFQSYCLSL